MSEPPTPPDGGQDSGKPEKVLKKVGRKKNKVLTQKVYNLLIDAFRKTPNNSSQASMAVGISPPTAKRGWYFGWPRQGWKPIKDVLKEEQQLARSIIWEGEEQAKKRAAEIEARAHEMLRSTEEQVADKQVKAEQEYTAKLEQAERDIKQRLADTLDKAKLNAAETMAAEAQISKSARGTALSLMSISANIFSNRNLPVIINLINTALSSPTAMTPREAANLLRAFGRFGIDVNQTGKLALDIERERLGQPTEVVQINLENMSLADALKEIDEAKAAADLLREERALAEDEGETGPNGVVH